MRSPSPGRWNFIFISIAWMPSQMPRSMLSLNPSVRPFGNTSWELGKLLTMLLLEDQHRAQSDGLNTTRSYINTEMLHFFQQRSCWQCVKSNVSSVEKYEYNFTRNRERKNGLALDPCHADFGSAQDICLRASRARHTRQPQLVQFVQRVSSRISPQ